MAPRPGHDRRRTPALGGDAAARPPRGTRGLVAGTVIADLSLGEPTTVELEAVQRQVFDVFDRDRDFWDADGLLADRRRAVREADDMRQLIEALETSIF